MRWLLQCIAAFCWLSTACATITEMPLFRVKSPTSMRALRNEVRQAMGLPVKAYDTDPIYLDSQLGLLVGNVSVGTPPQYFTMGLDTGSSDFWVIDTTCANPDCKGLPDSGFPKHSFNRNLSSTFVYNGTTISIQYVTGSESGFLGQDTIRFGGIVDLKQPIGVMTNMSIDDGYTPIDGIFGLAWPDLSAFNVIPPLFKVNMTQFSVWLDKHPLPTATYHGLITYGGLDKTNCKNDWNWVPLVPDPQFKVNLYWQYNLDRFKVGKHNFKHQGPTISDTGTSWMSAPDNVINAVVEATRAEYNLDDDVYEVDCSLAPQLPYLEFWIGGKKYELTPSQYLLPIDSSSTTCAVQVYPAAPEENTWLLGDVFMRAYCHAYDIAGQRVGFATSIHTTQ